MLYDPALVAAGEARRLKSVLDRVQEGAGGDVGGILGARHSKRESVMSYGTFGSLDRSDDEGWQFISVEGCAFYSRAENTGLNFSFYQVTLDVDSACFP